MLHHFILTRFNIRTFRHDKHGKSIDYESWLEDRLSLFETYTLPSVIGQTCQDFTWVLLVDSNTPADYRERMKGYRKRCPQISFISVKEQYGWKFAIVFQQVVEKMLREKGAQAGDLCLTTYFDNDDCLHRDYVNDVRELLLHDDKKMLSEEGFIMYDYGIQYYTELGIATRIKYANNHFLTLFETVSSAECPSVRTCYGYGSHFTVEKRGVVPVHHIAQADKPMWIEVIHQGNVDNDVKMTLHTSFVKDQTLLRTAFSLNIDLQTGKRLKFFTRYFKQILRRFRYRLFPRKW